ncbi:sugar phosphate isomerase/epimerase family protein [Haloactinomyces albus]|uniref:Sugar phosphate isomerase/epimerase n=1 Tax=Haloactinomyces albus TaxID=1352928 RepID=A0AAE3ZBC9_9ACTN|nr:TIM barrel protein [Haloactinomyces albus]MDR7299999.1 sugar phosphate isomerase/epimerase [Haloactinomyces albus]
MVRRTVTAIDADTGPKRDPHRAVQENSMFHQSSQDGFLPEESRSDHPLAGEPPTNERRRLGIGHLTALNVPPPDLVTIAAQAGFDCVGLRVATTTGQERRWPVDVGSPMLLETVRRLQATGLAVLDVEITSLQPDTAVADYEHVLETGVRLGARFLNVTCEDPDPDRAADTFAALVERAKLYEIRPALEAMPDKQVRTVEQARRIAERSDGGGVLLDALHLQRCGDSVDDVRALDPALLTYLQIRAAPRQEPGHGALPLAALLGAVPDDLPVSVEAPDLDRLAELGPQEFLRDRHDAARALLAPATVTS